MSFQTRLYELDENGRMFPLTVPLTHSLTHTPLASIHLGRLIHGLIVCSLVASSQVKSLHILNNTYKLQQTTIRKAIECAPEASSGGREWAEMTEGFHLET